MEKSREKRSSLPTAISYHGYLCPSSTRSNILSVYLIPRRVEGVRVFKLRASSFKANQAAIEEVKKDDERLSRYLD